MSFDWNNFFELAELLMSGSNGAIVLDVTNDEACQRSAVSRAYYAAFHKTCEFLSNQPKQKDLIPKGPSAHTKVPELMKTSGRKEWKKVGNKLETLRMDRNKADYDTNIPQLKSLAAKAMTSASNILESLRSF